LQLLTATAGGVYFSSSVLFFTRSAELTPIEIASGLTIAGIVGLLSPLPFGLIADRLGARNVTAWLTAGIGISLFAFVFVRSFLPFVLIACGFAACLRGAMAARMALVARLADAAARTRLSAFLRAFGNCGLSIGALVGSIALYLDTDTAYRASFVLSGLAYLGAAIGYLRLPFARAADLSDRRASIGVFADRPYVALTALNTVILLYIPLLNMVLPLWIVTHTAAPIWTASLLYGVNTICVMTMQVRLARGVENIEQARRSILSATFILSLACLGFAAMAGPSSAWIAVSIALAAAVLHAISEMLHMAGAWELSFALAPANKHGQYQGFFNMSSAAAEMLGPILLTLLLVNWGTPGWLVLAVAFPAAGYALVWLGRRMET